MAHDLDLERKIDQQIDTWDVKPIKKKMFGGIGYMIHGNMAFGVHKNEVVLRTTDAHGSVLLAKEGIRPFQIGNRTSMSGWYLAGSGAINSDTKLRQLLSESFYYVLTLPLKEKRHKG